MKLKKIQGRQWQGNGLGYSNAVYCLADYPYIRITSQNGRWSAFNDKNNKHCASDIKEVLFNKIQSIIE